MGGVRRRGTNRGRFGDFQAVPSLRIGRYVHEHTKRQKPCGRQPFIPVVLLLQSQMKETLEKNERPLEILTVANLILMSTLADV